MMQHLLDDLLAFSQVGRFVNTFTTIPMKDLVNEAVATVSGRLTEQNVEIAIASDLPEINGDCARLREAQENFIDNAAKFMWRQPNP